MTPAPRRSPRDTGARERVAALVGSLDGNDRALLALCLLEGLSPLEAGAALRTPSREVVRRLGALLGRLSRRARAVRAAVRRVA